jgi:hypothetical protein
VRTRIDAIGRGCTQQAAAVADPGGLERLVEGLSKEIAHWRGEENPLLFGERKRYLKEIHKALLGADAARVILARVVQRLEYTELSGQLPERS